MIPQGSQEAIVPLCISVHVSPFQISIHFICFDFFRGDRSGLYGVNLLRCPTLHLGDVRLPSGAVRG